MSQEKPKPVEMPEITKSKESAIISDEQPISTASIYFLNPDELSSYIKKGESGDVVSATKVLNYYTFSRLDRKKQIYWMKKSAILGDAISQFRYAIFLREEGQIKESIKWAEKSALSGNVEAKAFLAEIKSNGYNP
ncbi:hypothetical protein SAMN05660479_00997 [Microbulbifer thermotolerans]|uniref:sel1 repeat family protein n=1 Tax=Microbulbifer thermotolerans TaxID=252514 RepID=UPI0008EF61DD|nr:sel1 repeat family protein [Microbulbifer thermotolerans]SFB97775.1 hypothetical protein SAMN05660479_00997 [Microbulbifer thermotolerans]